ncbi:MAG: SirB2 family protein [Gammaproteobacteria bacterium]|nr:SirB2 family protein [Gammaproteobacteria bacterium]
MDIAALKLVHVGCAAISLAGFTARGLGMLRGSAWRRRRWVRIAPHVVDTLLLLSAIGLMVATGQYPFVHAWLTAKLLALIGYIVLGSLALNYGPTRTLRLGAWLAALAVFGYIVAVAVTRRVVPF